MHEVKISQKNKVILFLLLILLNFAIRVPSIPHEKGADSFFIHSLANSITNSGHANWWTNWLSIFGFYPLSYASGVPQLLSGLSQIMNIEMEFSILVLCIILGLFSIFSSYLLAGLIYEDFWYKYIFSFIFSLSQGILIFTTWEISSRIIYMVFIPLYIFLLLKALKSNNIKISFLLALFVLFLFSTHMFAYFVLIISLLTSIIFNIYYKIKLTDKIKIPYTIYSLGFFFIILLFLIIPFFERTLVSSGSRYTWIINAAIIEIRYVGPLIFFILGGLCYLVLKNPKRVEEIIMLFLGIFFIPIIFSQTYGHFVYLIFSIFFISIGLRNLLDINSKNTKTLLIIFLIFFVIFSGFYNHWRTKSSDDWFMKESIFSAGIWSMNYISNNSVGIGDENILGSFTAISNEHPKILSNDVLGLTYGFIDISKKEIGKNSPLTLKFYFDGPYILQSNQSNSIQGKVNWILERQDIDYKTVIDILNEYNVKYLIIGEYEKPVFNSIRNKKDLIFDNKKIKIYIRD